MLQVDVECHERGFGSYDAMIYVIAEADCKLIDAIPKKNWSANFGVLPLCDSLRTRRYPNYELINRFAGPAGLGVQLFRAG